MLMPIRVNRKMDQDKIDFVFSCFHAIGRNKKKLQHSEFFGVFFIEYQLFIRSMLNNIVNHGRVGECGGVAQAADFVGRHFPQNTAHDFTGAGFR